MRTSGQVGVGALVALAVAACSDDRAIGTTTADGGPGAGGAPSGGAPGASVVEPYVTALCGIARTCCARGSFPAAPLADCESEVVRQTNVLQYAADGTIRIDAAGLAQCASVISSFSNTCIYDTPAIQAACRTFYEGTRGEGESCSHSEECAGKPVVCFKVQIGGGMTPETGVCHVMKRATAGSSCITDGDDTLHGTTLSTPDATAAFAYCHTADGLFCSLGPKICTPFKTAGATCAVFNECAPGFYCDTTCRPVKADGSACTRGAECQVGRACVSGACAPPVVATDKLCGGDYN